MIMHNGAAEMGSNAFHRTGLATAETVDLEVPWEMLEPFDWTAKSHAALAE